MFYKHSETPQNRVEGGRETGGGRAKAQETLIINTRATPQCSIRESRNNKRNQYQMALLRKASKGKNISFQIDN